MEELEEFLIDEFHLGLLKVGSETIWMDVMHGRWVHDIDFFKYVYEQLNFIITYKHRPLVVQSHLQSLNPSNEPECMGGTTKIVAQKNLPIERQRIFLFNALYLLLKNEEVKGNNVSLVLRVVKERLHQSILTVFYFLSEDFGTDDFHNLRDKIEIYVETKDKVILLVSEIREQLLQRGFELDEVADLHTQRLLFRRNAHSTRFNQAFGEWKTQRFFIVFHQEIERLTSLQYLEQLKHSSKSSILEKFSIINNKNMTENIQTSKKVFIVHGHDELAKQTVARFLERLNLKAVILHEQSSGGKTIIEKLEHYTDVDFAIVLLTPDDVGGLAKDKENPDKFSFRARQNVVLELGYMMAKIGRSKVCALLKGKIEKPTDYDGVIYISMDENNGWKKEVLKELLAADFSIGIEDFALAG